MAGTKLDNKQKIKLHRSLFAGIEEVYGTYDPQSGRTWQVKRPITYRTVWKHLKGQQPLGVYLLTGDSTRAVVADFDAMDANPVRDFLAAAEHLGLPAYIERSKEKGYHAWVFFEASGVPAGLARAVLRFVLDDIGAGGTEVFPKQDRLDPGTNGYGNFIHTPLFGRLVPKGRTVFVSPKTLKPYTNQWAVLERVERVPETTLRDIAEINGLSDATASAPDAVSSLGCVQAYRKLPPCAITMLEEGVTHDQRVACFRLAVQLRRTGLPFDVTVAALKEWAKKNRPEGGKRIITEKEIKSQAASTYLKEYAGYGCEDPAVMPFCSPSCWLYDKRNGNASRKAG